MSRKEQKQSPLQRILNVMKYFELRGGNSERVNDVYRKIIKAKYDKSNR